MSGDEKVKFGPIKAAEADRSTPSSERPAVDIKNEGGVYGFDSRDQRSRPFNLLRSQILKAAHANGWRFIGVTSATPRVGKSFIASNLAAALSRTPELRTYLIDLDLRRSTVKDNFALAGDIGIGHFLDGAVDDLDSIARTIDGQALTVIPSFPYNQPSSELLGSARMDALITGFRALTNDTICVCDLPPVFANDDSMIIAQKIDAYILVVEDGVTTSRQVRDCLHLMQPLPCIGTVLNRYKGSLLGDSYGYGYGQGGKYADYYGR